MIWLWDSTSVAEAIGRFQLLKAQQFPGHPSRRSGQTIFRDIRQAFLIRISESDLSNGFCFFKTFLLGPLKHKIEVPIQHKTASSSIHSPEFSKAYSSCWCPGTSSCRRTRRKSRWCSFQRTSNTWNLVASSIKLLRRRGIAWFGAGDLDDEFGR